MIDVSELLNDPDLCSEFTIERPTGKFAMGGWQAGDPEIIPAYGAVRNLSGNEIQQLPEADRVLDVLSVRSVTPMNGSTTGNADGNAQTSDIIIWNGSRYRVVRTRDYSEQGYYYAEASRMEGN
jgi:hypothetical protein